MKGRSLGKQKFLDISVTERKVCKLWNPSLEGSNVSSLLDKKSAEFLIFQTSNQDLTKQIPWNGNFIFFS